MGLGIGGEEPQLPRPRGRTDGWMGGMNGAMRHGVSRVVSCRVSYRTVPYRLSNVKKEEMEGSKLEAEDEEDKKKIKRKTTTCTF